MKVLMVDTLWRRDQQGGFALPSVLIASVVMLIVLFSAVSAITASRAALVDQYYNQLAREAAESGLAMAEACLKENSYTAQWDSSVSRSLRPNTNCNGIVQASLPQHIDSRDNTQVSFTVASPETVSGGSVQFITATGSVSRVRASTGAVWKTYTAQTTGRVAAQAQFTNIAFGYYEKQGVFVGVIQPNGQVRTLGYNAFGQLGDGTTTDRGTPVLYNAPTGGAPIVDIHAQFLSLGTRMFAIDANGRAYASGMNKLTSSTAGGSLGTGSTALRGTTPALVQLPAGVRAISVATIVNVSYIIGSDNNIYAMGPCGSSGSLGSACTVGSGVTVPTRVALPTPNVANLNTLPVQKSGWIQNDNIAADGNSVIVRMQGGAIYGWGWNEEGQLGLPMSTYPGAVMTPQKIGTFGDAGQPKVVQVAGDGRTSYIRTDDGSVYATGSNFYGQLAGAGGPLVSNNGTGPCMDNAGDTTTNKEVKRYACNGSQAQQFMFTTDNKIKVKAGTSGELCLDLQSGSSAVSGSLVYLKSCAFVANQLWTINDAKEIRSTLTENAGKNLCLDNTDGTTTNGVSLQLYTCNGTAAQKWEPTPRSGFAKITIPGDKKIVRITNDHFTVLFLTEDGEVWGAGTNVFGMLGTGSVKRINPYLLRYGQAQIGASRRVVEFYNTGYDMEEYRESTGRGNTYVILSDGSVYGSGSNAQGQLGNGTVSPYSATPVQMQLPPGARGKQVQSGYGTTVVLTDRGQIYSVGSNSNGQLGDGTTTNRSIPIAGDFLNIFPTSYF